MALLVVINNKKYMYLPWAVSDPIQLLLPLEYRSTCFHHPLPVSHWKRTSPHVDLCTHMKWIMEALYVIKTRASATLLHACSQSVVKQNKRAHTTPEISSLMCTPCIKQSTEREQKFYELFYVKHCF